MVHIVGVWPELILVLSGRVRLFDELLFKIKTEKQNKKASESYTKETEELSCGNSLRVFVCMYSGGCLDSFIA